MKIFISNIRFAGQGDRTPGPPLPTPKCTLLETIISDTVALFVNNMAKVIL
jgi:hypothetical protein